MKCMYEYLSNYVGTSKFRFDSIFNIPIYIVAFLILDNYYY